MVGYTVKTRVGLLSVGPSNLRIGICGKAWRVGMGLGPSDSMWIAIKPER